MHRETKCKRFAYCGTNQVLEGGSAAAPGVCTTCGAGQYGDSHSRGADRFQCKTPKCDAGKRVVAARLRTGRLECAACEAGRFQNESGHAAGACKPVPPCVHGGDRTRVGSTKIRLGWCVGCGRGPTEADAGRPFKPSDLQFPCTGRACVHYYRTIARGSEAFEQTVDSLRASPNFPRQPNESRVLRDNATFALNDDSWGENYGVSALPPASFGRLARSDRPPVRRHISPPLGVGTRRAESQTRTCDSLRAN